MFSSRKEKQVHIKKMNKIEYLKTANSKRVMRYLIHNSCEPHAETEKDLRFNVSP
ncbi:MAG: hypothetical protein RL337_1340 [Bacteroidota bacterium]